MPKITFTTKDIDVLNRIQAKLYQGEILSSEERSILNAFLQHLPSATILLKERCLIDEPFEIEVFDISEMRPHMEKWINAFNSLPKNGDKDYPCAGWLDGQDDDTFWKRNVIIEAEFVPSLEFSKREHFKTIGLHLKTDGTAFFIFDLVNDARKFHELYQFNGSWRDAYHLVVKTLQQGWPQTKFPTEFEPFLKK